MAGSVQLSTAWIWVPGTHGDPAALGPGRGSRAWGAAQGSPSRGSGDAGGMGAGMMLPPLPP